MEKRDKSPTIVIDLHGITLCVYQRHGSLLTFWRFTNRIIIIIIIIIMYITTVQWVPSKTITSVRPRDLFRTVLVEA